MKNVDRVQFISILLLRGYKITGKNKNKPAPMQLSFNTSKKYVHSINITILNRQAKIKTNSTSLIRFIGFDLKEVHKLEYAEQLFTKRINLQPLHKINRHA